VTPPAAAEWEAAIEATWPAAVRRHESGWCLREGPGGQRVRAATAEGPADPADLPPGTLVRVRPGEDALDAALAAAGYVRHDPTLLLAAPVAELAQAPPLVTGFLVDWPPLEIQREIWAEGGIGPDRLAVMDRVAGPKCALLGRVADRPAGTGFAAQHDRIAMVHAVEVSPAHRRQKSAAHMMRAAALWAQDRGAVWLGVLVTEANLPARGLYGALGLGHVHGYHYRRKPA
jgi:GNAT superfamily N-acetyltransferase